MYTATAQRALVGDMVRQYREKAGLDLGDVAAILGCDRSKVSRIESGERGFRPGELRKLLTELGADADAVDLLAAISGWRDIAGWWRGMLSVLPSAYLDFVIPETFASGCQGVPVDRCLRAQQFAVSQKDRSDGQPMSSETQAAKEEG